MQKPRAHWFSALIATALLLAYLGPVVLKLNDIALWIVVLIGLAMMLVDLWESVTGNGS
jgi:hypothetical protein